MRALTESELLAVEERLCRTKLRVVLWNNAEFLTAVGRMVARLINEVKARRPIRNIDVVRWVFKTEIAQTVDDGARERFVTRLTKEFSKFLNGHLSKKNAKEYDWLSHAKNAIDYLLLGTENGSDSHRREIALRIKHFFFPPEGNGHQGFFAEELRTCAEPVRTREFCAELRALAAHARQGARIRITRASGWRRFYQACRAAESWELTETGRATVECLLAGVEISFIYPTFGHVYPKKSEAQESAEVFRDVLAPEFAQHRFGVSTDDWKLNFAGNLQTIAVSPSLLLECPETSLPVWSGEFLSKALCWAYYHREQVEEDIGDWLIVVRRHPSRPITFCQRKDHHDIELLDFRRWLGAVKEHTAYTEAAEPAAVGPR